MFKVALLYDGYQNASTSQLGQTLPSQQQTYVAVLSLKVPPVMVITVLCPQATIAPPSSSAWLALKVPPSMMTTEPPKSLLSPEQYIWTCRAVPRETAWANDMVIVRPLIDHLGVGKQMMVCHSCGRLSILVLPSPMNVYDGPDITVSAAAVSTKYADFLKDTSRRRYDGRVGAKDGLVSPLLSQALPSVLYH